MEENKNNEFEMNSNVNQTTTAINKQKKSKVVSVLVTIILILVLALALCIGNMYAMTKNYDNVFSMIGNTAAGEESTEEEKKIDNEVENNEDKKENNLNVEEEQALSDAEAQKIIQSYLNIKLRENTLPKSVLNIEEIGLVNSQEDFDKNSTNLGDYWHVSNNIKYSDFKDKMLEYMTEEIYPEDFSSSYKEVNGFLAALESYGKQIDSVKVDKVELLEEDNNKYVYKVEYTQYVKDETYPSKYKIELQKDKTGKYVVSFSDWWNEELEIGTYIENTEEEFGGEVKLLEDNKCIIHYGSMTGEIFSGTYEISGQTLVCELTKFIGDNIKDLNIDIKYYFDITDSENIKFRCVIGNVGKYYSTLPGEDGKPQGEYDFKEEWHFSEGETFTFEK